MGRDPSLRKHLAALRELGCVVSGHRGPGLTLHHCHSGSMRCFGVIRGVGLKTSDWLQIPLAWKYHVGDQGVDVIGVETWEERFGTQVDHLEAISWKLGYSVFRLAGLHWPSLEKL